MRRSSVTAFVGVLLLFGATEVSAQESAGGLGTPRPGVTAPPRPATPPPPPSSAYGLAPPAPPTAPSVASPEALQLRIPSDVATRLRVLDGSLRALASRGAGSPLDGIMSIVSGGLSITFGVLYDDQLSSYLYLFGASYIARGVMSLVFRPDVVEPAITFGHMPMTGPEQVEARLRFGEASLEYLARRFRTARLLDAGINLTVGLLVIPVYLGPSDFHVDDFYDYFVIVGAGISIISGIIGLASKTEAERRWTAYRQLRDRLEAEKEPHAPHAARTPRGLRFAGWGAAPVRGGAAVGVRTTF